MARAQITWHFLASALCFVVINAQYLGAPHAVNYIRPIPHNPRTHGVIETHVADQGHQQGGHLDHDVKYDDDREEYGEENHGRNAHHEEMAHGAQASHQGHRNKNAHRHNKGTYVRNRGYGYEKAYGYDNVRSEHDQGSHENEHSQHQANRAQHGHRQADSHAVHGHAKHAHKDRHHGETHKHEDNRLNKHNKVLIKVHDDVHNVHHSPRLSPIIKPVVPAGHVLVPVRAPAHLYGYGYA